jgi:hypothetical protein
LASDTGGDDILAAKSMRTPLKLNLTKKIKLGLNEKIFLHQNETQWDEHLIKWGL